MRQRGKEVWQLYKRLRRFAGCFTRNADLAADAASHAICAAIASQDKPTWQFCAVACKNYIARYWRDRRRRNEHYIPDTNEEGLPGDFPEGSFPAPQPTVLAALECVNAIDGLPPNTRAVMEYVAQEYTIDEIAAVLDVPKKKVEKCIQYGRKILRDRDGYELERKRGHHKFIGVFKRRHRWEAVIRQGEEVRYLGYFGSASEAAKAYDEAAKELRGPETKMNFPTNEVHP